MTPLATAATATSVEILCSGRHLIQDNDTQMTLPAGRQARLGVLIATAWN